MNLMKPPLKQTPKVSHSIILILVALSIGDLGGNFQPSASPRTLSRCQRGQHHHTKARKKTTGVSSTQAVVRLAIIGRPSHGCRAVSFFTLAGRGHD